MSDQITTAMIDTFNSGIRMLAQQTNSKLVDRVMRESEEGERNAFDQLGPVKAHKIINRHGDTEYVNSPHKKRWVTTDTFDVADLLDLRDAVRILNNPGGAYARNFIAALNRERDASIVSAALGSAFTGKAGTTAVPLPSSSIIVDGATGFTLAKIKAAAKIMKAGNAVDMGSDLLTVAWTAAQEDEFLDTTEVKSHDFNTQRVLMKGGLDGDDVFYGFNYVRLEDWTDETAAVNRILPKTGTVRSCVAFLKTGITFNEPIPPTVKVDQLPGKKYSWQWYGYGDFGAVRMQEPHVIQIDVQEP